MPEKNLYYVEKTALPQDTKQALGTKRPNNFALLFNRMAHFAIKENLEESWSIGNLLNGEIKAHFFHKSRKQQTSYHLNLTEKWEVSQEQKNDYKLFLESYMAAAVSLYGCEPFTLKSDWRIALGMGNASVYENGFTFHPTFGIPYLPGSSLKGMTRHWAMAVGKPEKTIKEIFGHENDVNVQSEEFRQGQIIFFDALPTDVSQNMVQPDIMNNHYPDYYEGNKYPADWLSPRPIFFLTMKDISFQFCLGYTHHGDSSDSKALLQMAQEWLTNALEESGVGAKTAVGYGRMRANNSNYTPPSKERRPMFKEGGPNRKLKKDDLLEAEVTKPGKPCHATLYGYGNTKYEDVLVSGNTADLKVGDLIEVKITAIQSGEIKSVSLSKAKLT